MGYRFPFRVSMVLSKMVSFYCLVTPQTFVKEEHFRCSVPLGWAVNDPGLFVPIRVRPCHDTFTCYFKMWLQLRDWFVQIKAFIYTATDYYKALRIVLEQAL